jgi:hypothetical protein
MGTLLLLKNIFKQTAIALNFRNSDQVIKWWIDIPCPEEFITVYEGKRKKSGHRYELKYSKFDESGKLYTKYIICISKKEALLLAEKIKKINPNYITQIKKIY